MNLFVLSSNPKEAAQAHGDKHVVKMVLEACQMLYSAHWTAVYPHLLEERSAIRLSVLHKTLDIPFYFEDAPVCKARQEPGFRPVHLHHPCTIWIRYCLGNYMWAVDLAMALAEEYEYRWPGKIHSCKAHVQWLKENVPDIRPLPRMGFAIAMDSIYRVKGDPIASYINFYKTSKKERGLLVYTRRSNPYLNKI
jgi:hypothetical protein